MSRPRATRSISPTSRPSKRHCPKQPQRTWAAVVESLALGNGIETDAHRIAQRQKQIDYGKNTLAYDKFSALWPREKRKRWLPMTPLAKQRCSKRSFMGQVTSWKKKVYEFVANLEENEQKEKEKKHVDSKELLVAENSEKGVDNGGDYIDKEQLVTCANYDKGNHDISETGKLEKASVVERRKGDSWSGVASLFETPNTKEPICGEQSKVVETPEMHQATGHVNQKPQACSSGLVETLIAKVGKEKKNGTENDGFSDMEDVQNCRGLQSKETGGLEYDEELLSDMEDIQLDDYGNLVESDVTPPPSQRGNDDREKDVKESPPSIFDAY